MIYRILTMKEAGMREFPAEAGKSDVRQGDARKAGEKNRRQFLIDSTREIAVYAAGFAVLTHLAGCSDKEGDPVSPDPNAAASVQLDLSQSQFSALGTVGLSTGITGAGLATVLKGTLIVDMLLGRIEIIPLCILFMPRTWWKRGG